MPRPSTAVERIKMALEPFLDEAEREWQEQPAGRRRPTLPHTPAPEMKLDVTELCRRARLKENDTQYFHKTQYRELRELVNVFAQAQGLKPIGARAAGATAEDHTDDELMDVVVRRARQEQDRQTARNAQAQARVAYLERELAELRDRYHRLEQRLVHTQRTGLLVRDGGEVS